MERLLKPDAPGRRDAQQTLLDKVQAQRIERDVKARKEANPVRQLPTPPRKSGPVFWDAKEQGQPFVGHAAPSEPRYARVEIRPGVFHVVQLPDRPEAGRAGAGVEAVRRERPSSAPVRGRHPGSPGPGAKKPYQVDTVELAPALSKLESAMREVLRRRAALHIKERTILLRAFAKVLGKRDVNVTMSDKVTSQQFMDAWRELGLSVGQDLAYATFNKYGQDVKGMMPVLNYVDALSYGAPRQLMLEHEQVQHGAYRPGGSATHLGKIKYPQCKKGVWPPSNWDPRAAERSAQLPDVRLKLEFVYGYDGFQATAPNIFYTRSGRVAYFAAAVGIVYDKPTQSQRLFLEHDDDITSMAIHPDGRTIATGQVGHDPVAIVWDAEDMRTIQTIPQGPGNRGITACCFSPDGTKLVCICTDNQHTMYIWDWKRKRKLMENKTFAGTPPATYGVIWDRFDASRNRLVTWGQNHIKFWDLSADPRDPSGTALSCATHSGSFSASTQTHTVLSACYLPSGVVLSGSSSGSICSWRSYKLMRETGAHAPGPLLHRPDGSPMYSGVRCLVLQSRDVLLSGGADGFVIKWDVSSGDLGPRMQVIPILHPDQVGKMVPPALRALDCYPGSDVFIAGSASCDLWEVDDTPEVLVQGSPASLCGLAMNPRFPHVFATISEADTVVVYSAATRKLAGRGEVCRSGAFSPDGEHLAVGLSGGGIKIMEFHPQVFQRAWMKDSNEAIDELKYSPCGTMLAAGSHDQTIYIYDVHAGYKLRTRCVGHSSTITHLDWSLDSTVIQSNDQAYELLYLDPRTGKQVKENQRDTRWATWTCVLGFDVMGIWPRDSDGTDINSCDRSPSGRYLLTADDFGKIKLFNYPVVVQHAPALVYPGHSSHVPNVRWAVDESYAISVGGRDRCTFQFRIDTDKPAQPTKAYGFNAVDASGVVWSDPQVMQEQMQAYQQQQDRQQKLIQKQQAAAGGAGAGAGQRTPSRTGQGAGWGAPGNRAMASPSRPAAARAEAAGAARGSRAVGAVAGRPQSARR